MSISFAIYGRHAGHARAVDVERWGTPAQTALPRFAITRNPWDRLVSAYRFARNGRGIGGPLQAPVLRPQQYRVREFDTFERFVREWLVPRMARQPDIFFRPQSEFVCDPAGKLLVDHLGRLEDLQPTIAFIEKTLGKAIEVPMSNRSGDPVDYRAYYTPELAEIVGQIYADDVDRFGYSFER